MVEGVEKKGERKSGLRINFKGIELLQFTNRTSKYLQMCNQLLSLFPTTLYWPSQLLLIALFLSVLLQLLQGLFPYLVSLSTKSSKSRNMATSKGSLTHNTLGVGSGALCGPFLVRWLAFFFLSLLSRIFELISSTLPALTTCLQSHTTSLAGGDQHLRPMRHSTMRS